MLGWDSGLGRPWEDKALGVVRGAEMPTLQERTDRHSYCCSGWSELARVELASQGGAGWPGQSELASELAGRNGGKLPVLTVAQMKGSFSRAGYQESLFTTAGARLLK